MSEVKYFELPITVTIIPDSVFHESGRDGMGYGLAIKTPYIVHFEYQGKKHARQVQATCISNAASHWIRWMNAKFHFRGDILDIAVESARKIVVS